MPPHTAAGSVTLRAKDAGSSRKRCAGAAGYDLSDAPGRDTVWEIAPVNPGVGDLSRDAVYVYTTLAPGCTLYLTAPGEDGCGDATVSLQPALPQYAQQQRWALAAVTGRPGVFSIVAMVGRGGRYARGCPFPGACTLVAAPHPDPCTHLPCHRALHAPQPYWARAATVALWHLMSSEVLPGCGNLQLAANLAYTSSPCRCHSSPPPTPRPPKSRRRLGPHGVEIVTGSAAPAPAPAPALTQASRGTPADPQAGAQPQEAQYPPTHPPTDATQAASTPAPAYPQVAAQPQEAHYPPAHAAAVAGQASSGGGGC